MPSMETYEKVTLSVLVAVAGFWLFVWFFLTVIEGLAPYGVGIGD
jgi:hypothetical protein